MDDERVLRDRLAEEWGLCDVRVTAHHGGMNSATWIVHRDTTRWIAKSVKPSSRDHFLGGLELARHVEHAGIPAGAPVQTRDGRLATTMDDRPLALLTWVPGTELTGAEPGAQPLMGTTLAAVHHALAAQRISDPQRFHWVNPRAAHLDVRPWVRLAVAAAVRALTELDIESLTWGMLHADPAPEAFRYDEVTGVCGLIDWSGALTGPLLYDLASAVMYVGGPDRAAGLVDAYLRRGPLDAAEVRRGLATMLRFRWAVQADYFARRIVENDLTGIAGPQDNEVGLGDAERHLSTR